MGGRGSVAFHREVRPHQDAIIIVSICQEQISSSSFVALVLVFSFVPCLKSFILLIVVSGI